MATDPADQELVAELAAADPRVVPAFGFHPWAAHRIGSGPEHYAALFGAPPTPDAQRALELLPPPLPLADALADLRAHLMRYPHALLGEVGLDRSFRLPAPPGAATRLVPLQTPLEHQMALLEAQVRIAVELGRSVSMHSVRAAGPTLAFLDRLYAHADAPPLVLHSCTMSPESIVQVQRRHARVYVSFSMTINARQRALDAQIAACDPARLLCESDTSADFAEHTAAAAERIARVWGVSAAEAGARLADNFWRFCGNKRA